MDELQGYIDFHVAVEIVDTLIRVKDKKTGKKVKRPGYTLIVFQNMALEDKEWESYIVNEESFKKDELKKAFDVFQREILNIQNWIEIAESRARLIPTGSAVFECWFCGWVWAYVQLNMQGFGNLCFNAHCIYHSSEIENPA